MAKIRRDQDIWRIAHEAGSSDAIMKDLDATLGQQILDVPKAERKAEIQPDGIPDDIRWKAVAVI